VRNLWLLVCPSAAGDSFVAHTEGFRQDGRRPLELRRMRCRLSVLPAADGSALLDQGTTKVLAAVYGPREVPQRGDVLHDRCSIRCDCTYVRARRCTALWCGVVSPS
jgi:exosome complex component RRP41